MTEDSVNDSAKKSNEKPKANPKENPIAKKWQWKTELSERRMVAKEWEAKMRKDNSPIVEGLIMDDFDPKFPLTRHPRESVFWHTKLLAYYDLGPQRNLEWLFMSELGSEDKYVIKLDHHRVTAPVKTYIKNGQPMTKEEIKRMREIVRTRTFEALVRAARSFLWEQRCSLEHDLNVQRRIENERRLREEEHINYVAQQKKMQMSIATASLAIAGNAINKIMQQQRDGLTLPVKDIIALAKLGTLIPKEVFDEETIANVAKTIDLLPSDQRTILANNLQHLE